MKRVKIKLKLDKLERNHGNPKQCNEGFFKKLFHIYT